MAPANECLPALPRPADCSGMIHSSPAAVPAARTEHFEEDARGH